jgi:aminobenzoyl-glutamate utilization protein B
LLNSELVDKAWDYFENVQTKDTKYKPLISESDQPAIDLNVEHMAKFREEMRKYYYDPTKYKTYLEQLGVTYPTLKKEEGKN